MICCWVRWTFSHNVDKDALSCFEETTRTFGSSNEVMWLCHEPMIAADQRTLIACLLCFIILYKCYRLPLSALFATCVSAEFAQITESTSNCLHLSWTLSRSQSGERSGASQCRRRWIWLYTMTKRRKKMTKNMNKNLVLCHVLFECCLKVCEVGMCSDCFTMKKNDDRGDNSSKNVLFWLNCKALITISSDATGRTLDFIRQTRSLWSLHSFISWCFSRFIFWENHYVYWAWAEINEWKGGRVNCFRSMSQCFCGVSIRRDETLVHQTFSLHDRKRETAFCLLTRRTWAILIDLAWSIALD